MEAFIEIIKLVIPAALVLYAMYLTFKSFLNKDLEKKMLEIRSGHTATVLPIRLQAYERICLLLERISPQNLIVRLNTGKYTAQEFQQIMLHDIREEFNHNVSQQVYMSDEAWSMVNGAREELVLAINDAASKVNPDSSSLDLAKVLIETMMAKNIDPIANALKTVKDEIREVF